MKKPLCILTIAGSDSGAGAGVQADARTIQALGGYALTAITAVTAQNGRGVTAWKAVEPRLIAAQIDAVMEGFSVAAVKTGVLPGAAAVQAVARALAPYPRLPLVIDPVVGSTSGTRFLAPAGLLALRKAFLLRATLITPNWAEAQALTGLRVGSAKEAEEAALRLIEIGWRAALVKGGHGPGEICRDCLAVSDGKVRWYESPRIATRNTHGTGCVLSSAIAVGLARGKNLETSVTEAKHFIWKSLQASRKRFFWKGAGPAFSGV